MMKTVTMIQVKRSILEWKHHNTSESERITTAWSTLILKQIYVLRVFNSLPLTFMFNKFENIKG